MLRLLSGVSMVGETVSHYRVVEELGRGGMGVVYRAEDLSLGRGVALKFLSESLAGDSLAGERFLREARTAAVLAHPNICTVYEIAEHHGRRFIAMELLQGEPLRARMQGTPLPVDQVLDWGWQVCDALHAAHAAGVVHRDIKPANIFLTHGGALKVVDFGLAKTAADTAAADQPTQSLHLTNPGTAVGTVAYMSPEQARGLALDARSDLFSLGVVLYELITGRLPFPGNTSAEMFAALLHRAPEPPLNFNRAVPARLQEIVAKALEKDPDVRYQSAAEMRADLKRLKRDTESGPVPLAKAKPLRAPKSAARMLDSIAVLPLVNSSGEAETEYFVDGVTETIIASLSQLPKVRVMARSTVFRYKGKDIDAQTAGRELNVRAVLTGRIVQRGDSLIIGAELVDTADGAQLWSCYYNRKMADVFALQDQIASDIVGGLRVKLTPEQKKRMRRASTTDTVAYQLYLKGRHNANRRSAEGFQRAIEFYKQALEKDPDYALALTGMADVFVTAAFYGVGDSMQALGTARRMTERALQLAPTLSEAHVSHAGILAAYDWKYAEAEREFRTAIELNANNAAAHHWYSLLCLNSLRRHSEAIEEMRRAHELDPLSPPVNAHYSAVCGFAGEYDRGIAIGRNALEFDPNNAEIHWTLATCYEGQGKFEEAIRLMARAAELSQLPRYSVGLAQARILAGQTEEARALLLAIESTAGPRIPADVGYAFGSLGDREKFRYWAERAFTDHHPMLPVLLALPSMTPQLLSDPFLHELRRRVGVPEPADRANKAALSS